MRLPEAQSQSSEKIEGTPHNRDVALSEENVVIDGIALQDLATHVFDPTNANVRVIGGMGLDLGHVLADGVLSHDDVLSEGNKEMAKDLEGMMGSKEDGTRLRQGHAVDI